jgi:hypothetical protein
VRLTATRDRVSLADTYRESRGVTADDRSRVSDMMIAKPDFSRLRTLAFAALLAAALATPSACRPLPIQEVDLTETTWVLASVDGQPTGIGSPPRVTFHDLDNVTIASACETIDAGLALETDSDGLGFAEPIIRTAKPCDDEDEAEARLQVDAILDTETWKVVDRQTIELTGSHVLLFERVE